MHKSHSILVKELKKAANAVSVGGYYYHYKNPDVYYKVLRLAITEEDETVCVIYQAQHGEKLVFVRPLSSWQEKVDWNGENIDRFTFIK